MAKARSVTEMEVELRHSSSKNHSLLGKAATTLLGGFLIALVSHSSNFPSYSLINPLVFTAYCINKYYE